MLLCRAKLNLFLAINGLRSDGYHDLLSLMVPLNWGDRLRIDLTESDRFVVEGVFSPGVPTDGSNLVLKARTLFRSETDWRDPVSIILEKSVPHGAGLGGGSSDAAHTLILLNKLAGNLLDEARLEQLAAQLGSDVAFFIKGCSQIVSGKGERLECLEKGLLDALNGWHFTIINPTFSIGTAWGYGQLKADPRYYLPWDSARRGLERTLSSLSGPKMELYNSFEGPIFKKFPIYKLLGQKLSELSGVSFALSGSGSACFVAYRAVGLRSFIRKIVENTCGEFTHCAEV